MDVHVPVCMCVFVCACVRIRVCAHTRVKLDAYIYYIDIVKQYCCNHYYYCSNHYYYCTTTTVLL
jgi:hypothetical protein